MLDEVVIAIGINDSKRTYFTVEQRLEMLRDLFRDNPRIRVVSYDSLTIDLAKQWNARFILRGIRSVNDFEYEKTIADVNREIIGGRDDNFVYRAGIDSYQFYHCAGAFKVRSQCR